MRERRASRLHLGSAWLLAGVVLFAALFGLVAFQTVLIGGQAQVDELSELVREQEEVQRQLVVAVADMRAPERILEEARTQLGMVEPSASRFIGTDGELIAEQTTSSAPSASEPAAG